MLLLRLGPSEQQSSKKSGRAAAWWGKLNVTLVDFGIPIFPDTTMTGKHLDFGTHVRREEHTRRTRHDCTSLECGHCKMRATAIERVQFELAPSKTGPYEV